MAREKRLIDANALMEAIKEDHDYIMQDPEVISQMKWREAVCFHRAWDAITKAPTVDAVEVVHGRWLNVKETEVYAPDHRCTFTHTAETCSVCNIRSGFIGAKFYLYDKHCPNCGAKMDLKGE